MTGINTNNNTTTTTTNTTRPEISCTTDSMSSTTRSSSTNSNSTLVKYNTNRLNSTLLPPSALPSLPTTLQQQQQQQHQENNHPNATSTPPIIPAAATNRSSEAMKQLLCGGIAGSVAKTITAPFSRLTILYQVHSLVTTKYHRPKFAMTLRGGMAKIIERGGFKSFWKGNMTSVLHRFPYSAINFYVYENTMDFLAIRQQQNNNNNNQNQQNLSSIIQRPQEKDAVTQRQLVRRVTKLVIDLDDDDDYDDYDNNDHRKSYSNNNITSNTNHKQQQKQQYTQEDNTPAIHKFIAGALAGTVACTVCYPLDLVRTRLTTELEGHEHYRGMVDAFQKIYKNEKFFGFYSGIGPTLLVAVPNFAISYTVYGTLKEHVLEDELFYNLRKINADSGETKLGFVITVLCGAASGSLATLVTFPMDTVRRRMQVQNLHILDPSLRLTSFQTSMKLIQKEGLSSLYRGLTPELLKVIPMVGTMFTVYETTKELLHVS